MICTDFGLLGAVLIEHSVPLFFQNLSSAQPEWRTIYSLAEAKFMAESSGGVWQWTLAMVKRTDGSGLGSFDLKTIRELWDTKGKPHVPEDAEEVVAESLKNVFWDLK
jgi:hypothetical protein